jgi:hypothetical protein
MLFLRHEIVQDPQQEISAVYPQNVEIGHHHARRQKGIVNTYGNT